MNNFSIKLSNNDILINDKKTLILSGSIHYFRTLPTQWEDRLSKLKLAGFNCVETYIPWNLHEPKENEFYFEKLADIESFIKIAAKVGLYIIIRPSPYICAEWEFGGLPSWLLKYDLELRCLDIRFLKFVDRYFDIIIPKLLPYLSTNGGPIIAMQIENEYGSYGNDSDYIKYMKSALTNRNIDIPLFTSDGPTDLMLHGGTEKDTWKTLNFGSGTLESFKLLEQHQSNLPKMVMEFWIGWFDHWGESHHIRDYSSILTEFKEMLSNNISVNFYMFHGGTNFGYFNGANHDGQSYQPTITSYDYDSLLDESGTITKKYLAIKEIINEYKKKNKIKYLNENIPKIISNEKQKYEDIKITHYSRLFDNLSNISTLHRSTHCKTMEELGQDYGYIIYETEVLGTLNNVSLSILEVHDRAQIYLNDEFQGIIDRNKKEKIKLTLPNKKNKLLILVENLGRINYGPYLKDKKGITSGVLLENQFLFNWIIYTIPFSSTQNIAFKPINQEEIVEHIPTIYKGYFKVDTIGDTYLDTTHWGRGVVFINDFNIGRYWEIGPQESLYIPQDLLKIGENSIVILELYKSNKIMSFSKKMKWKNYILE